MRFKGFKGIDEDYRICHSGCNYKFDYFFFITDSFRKPYKRYSYSYWQSAMATINPPKAPLNAFYYAPLLSIKNQCFMCWWSLALWSGLFTIWQNWSCFVIPLDLNIYFNGSFLCLVWIFDFIHFSLVPPGNLGLWAPLDARNATAHPGNSGMSDSCLCLFLFFMFLCLTLELRKRDSDCGIWLHKEKHEICSFNVLGLWFYLLDVFL